MVNIRRLLEEAGFSSIQVSDDQANLLGPSSASPVVLERLTSSHETWLRISISLDGVQAKRWSVWELLRFNLEADLFKIFVDDLRKPLQLAADLPGDLFTAETLHATVGAAVKLAEAIDRITARTCHSWAQITHTYFRGDGRAMSPLWESAASLAHWDLVTVLDGHALVRIGNTFLGLWQNGRVFGVYGFVEPVLEKETAFCLLRAQRDLRGNKFGLDDFHGLAVAGELVNPDNEMSLINMVHRVICIYEWILPFIKRDAQRVAPHSFHGLLRHMRQVVSRFLF